MTLCYLLTVLAQFAFTQTVNHLHGRVGNKVLLAPAIHEAATLPLVSTEQLRISAIALTRSLAARH